MSLLCEEQQGLLNSHGSQLGMELKDRSLCLLEITGLPFLGELRVGIFFPWKLKTIDILEHTTSADSY